MRIPARFVDTPQTRASLVKYYAEITDFDRELGECLAAVKKFGREEDTIFIYTSEQGAQFPGGKWTCYDMGLHVALVVRWPRKIKAGSVANAMVQYVDVVPTLLEAVGGSAVEGSMAEASSGFFAARPMSITMLSSGSTPPGGSSTALPAILSAPYEPRPISISGTRSIPSLSGTF